MTPSYSLNTVNDQFFFYLDIVLPKFRLFFYNLQQHKEPAYGRLNRKFKEEGNEITNRRPYKENQKLNFAPA